MSNFTKCCQVTVHMGKPVCIPSKEGGILQISDFGQSDVYKVESDCFDLHFLIMREFGYSFICFLKPVRFPHLKIIDCPNPLNYLGWEVSCLFFCLSV